MKKFTIGVLVGLMLSATPMLAEWGGFDGGDRAALGKLVSSISLIATSLKRIADTMERQTPQIEWSARSLERITRAQEKIANCCACPAEKR